MKILPISSNYKQTQYQNTSNQSLCLNNNKNTISFGANPSRLGSFLKRLLKQTPIIKDKSQLRLPGLNREVVIQQMKPLTQKDGVQILTRDICYYKIIHAQDNLHPKASDEIKDKVKGNVVLFSSCSGINTSSLAEFLKNGATHIFSVNREAKRIDVLELPEYSASLERRIQSINKAHQKEHNAIFKLDPLDPFDPPLQSDQQKLGNLEQKYIQLLIEKLGIKQTKYGYNATPNSYSFNAIR